ncbi:MAG: type II toxin-antitoxin system HicB family antitoxin [Patescibacteria group bacterium]
MSPRILSYTVIFEPAEEGGFVVSIPMLPGCMSQGETFEEAKKIFKMQYMDIWMS